MICPNCKKELPEVGRFCGYCGAALEQESKEIPSETLPKKLIEELPETPSEELPETSSRELFETSLEKLPETSSEKMPEASSETIIENIPNYNEQSNDKIDRINEINNIDEIDEIDDMKTVMANGGDIANSKSGSKMADDYLNVMDSKKTDRSNNSNNNINNNSNSNNKYNNRNNNNHNNKRNNTGNARQLKKQKKTEKHLKSNSTSKWIIALSGVAVILIVVIGLLSFRLLSDARGKNWIVQLEELECTQKLKDEGILSTYQLDGEFERMSVKAVIKQIHDSSLEQDTKLLQIWIDDSLVYEIEAGEIDKEEWTFAIDLRGVKTMTILTSTQTTLDDVQMIRQSAEEKTEAEDVKEKSQKMTTKTTGKTTSNKKTNNKKANTKDSK